MLDRLLAMVDPLVTGGSGTSATLAMIPAEVLAHARIAAMRVRALGERPPLPWVRLGLDEAIAYFRAAGDRRGEGRALHQLANFLGNTNGDGPESKTAALNAIDAATYAGDALTLAFAHGRVARADHAGGRDEEAGERFATALRLAEASGDTMAITNACFLRGGFLFNRRDWKASESHFARIESSGGQYTAISRWRRADIAMHTGDFPVAQVHLNGLAEGIATGSLAARNLPLYQLLQGNLARLEGRMEVAYACFREVLATVTATHSPFVALSALIGLAMMDGMAGPGGSAQALLVRAFALDPQGNESVLQLPAMVAAVAEQVVDRNPAEGILIGAMASTLGMRAWFQPMYAQDVARISELVDRAREKHGIPVPDVPADLTAADAIAECLTALASLDATQAVTQ
jgi:tetratricopeptide (TPR) repeat protein